jgi:hypothetical protein
MDERNDPIDAPREHDQPREDNVSSLTNWSQFPVWQGSTAQVTPVVLNRYTGNLDSVVQRRHVALVSEKIVFLRWRRLNTKDDIQMPIKYAKLGPIF